MGMRLVTSASLQSMPSLLCAVSIITTRMSFDCPLSMDTCLLSTPCFNFRASCNQPISQTLVTRQASSSIISSRRKLWPAFAELQCTASSSHSCDSDQNLLFNILNLAHFIRPRISEYAQTPQDKVDYHVFPSGTWVIKAFTANDFVFYDRNGHVLKKIDNSSLILAASYRSPGASRRTVQTTRRSNSPQIQRTLQYAPSGEHYKWS